MEGSVLHIRSLIGMQFNARSCLLEIDGVGYKTSFSVIIVTQPCWTALNCGLFLPCS